MLTGRCHCGALTWTFSTDPGSATACNCTICRRYGALWIYGSAGVDATVAGPSKAYSRGRTIDYHFCPTCGCLTHYIATRPEEDGTTKLVVNIRMADDPDAVAALPIDHFDGLHTFTDLPRDGRSVVDMWF